MGMPVFRNSIWCTPLTKEKALTPSSVMAAATLTSTSLAGRRAATGSDTCRFACVAILWIVAAELRSFLAPATRSTRAKSASAAAVGSGPRPRADEAPLRSSRAAARSASPQIAQARRSMAGIAAR